MEKQEQVKAIYNIMLTWQENYSFDSYSEVIDLISEYNSEHPEDEIFFCQDGNRYYLECDYIEVL